MKGGRVRAVNAKMVDSERASKSGTQEWCAPVEGVHVILGGPETRYGQAERVQRHGMGVHGHTSTSNVRYRETVTD